MPNPTTALMMMPMLRPPAVEIDHRLNSRYRDVRFLPNSGAKADVARRRGWANKRLMHRSKTGAAIHASEQRPAR